MKSLETFRFAFLLLALAVLMAGCRFSYSGTSSGEDPDQGAQGPVASSKSRLASSDESDPVDGAERSGAPEAMAESGGPKPANGEDERDEDDSEND